MTDSVSTTDRRSVLRRAGLLAAGGVLASGTATAAECYRTQFWIRSFADSSDPDSCVGSGSTMVPAGTYGRVSVYCGDYDRWAYFECQDDPSYTGWIDTGALVRCSP